MSRWEVYSFLKQQNGQVSEWGLRTKFPDISKRELKEGVTEYNLMASRDTQFDECPAKV